MRLINLLITCPCPPTEIGGPNTFALNFKNKNCHVSTFHFSDFKLGFKSISTLLKLLSDLFKLCLALRRVDIVVNQDVQLVGFVVSCLGVLLNKKIVTRVTSDPICDRELNVGKIGRFTLYLRRSLLLYNIAMCNKVVVPSITFKSELITKYSINRLISVVYNPINQTHAYEWLPRSHHPVRFVYAGRFERQKNIDKIINSFLSLDEKFSAELLLIGDGSQSDFLKKCAGNSERIKFLGALNRSQLRVEFSRANYYINIASGETFCFTLFESLSLGCFPVLIDNPLFQELTFGFEHVEFINPSDINNFSFVLERLICIKSPLIRYSVARWLKKFSQDAISSEWDNILDIRDSYDQKRKTT